MTVDLRPTWVIEMGDGEVGEYAQNLHKVTLTLGPEGLTLGRIVSALEEEARA